MSYLLGLCSGLLTAAAFWGGSWSWLAWIALVPLFQGLERCPDRRSAVLTGFIYGAFFFALNSLWIFSLHRFVPGWVVLAWLAIFLFQSVYGTIFGLVFYWLKKTITAEKTMPFVLSVALVWTLIDKLRAWGPLGFTLGGLGYSQAERLPLIQIASLGQVYAVTFLVVSFNLAVWAARKGKWLPLLGTLLLIGSSLAYGQWALNAVPPPAGRDVLRLMIVQPNTDQLDKLSYDRLAPVFRQQSELTLCNLAEKPQLIIWPEASVFQVFLLDQPALVQAVQGIATTARAWFVLGASHYEQKKAYNSIYCFSPEGRLTSRYDKHQLVPFGEYLPFRPVLYPLLKGVGYYNSEYSIPDRVQDFRIGSLEVNTVMCFESMFPEIVHRQVKPGTAFILLLTNDAWFDGSDLARFHLDCGIFRAVENRLYFVQAGNTGLSAVIDPWGRIVKRLPPNRAAVLNAEIPLP